MTKENYTHITLVVDRSGSMTGIAESAEESLRGFVAEQAAIEGELTLTLIDFDNQYTVVSDFSSAEDLFGDWHLLPRGSTALLDAIGVATVTTGEALAKLEEDARPDKVICVIVTDGGENSSKEYTRDKIFNLIKQQEDEYGWAYIYLAAGQDAIAVGSKMGFSNNSNYTASAGGVQAAYAGTSASVTAFRTAVKGTKLQVETTITESK